MFSSSSPQPPPPSSSKTTSTSNGPQLTTCEANSLAHWSLYGRSRDPQAPVVTRTAPPEAPKQMSKPEFSAWNIPIPSSQLEKLSNGFEPVQMEDKWFVYSEDIDSGADSAASEKGDGPIGNGEEDKSIIRVEGEFGMKIYMVRSWTGNPIYQVEVLMWRKAGCEGGEIEGRITGLVWESDDGIITGQDEDVAKERAREVFKWVLGVSLLPDVPRRRREKVR